MFVFKIFLSSCENNIESPSITISISFDSKFNKVSLTNPPTRYAFIFISSATLPIFFIKDKVLFDKLFSSILFILDASTLQGSILSFFK